MSDLFLFVRPPRPLWPFNGPGSAFWPPLAFASMAASLRENVRNLQIGILDAPAQKMGWRTFEQTVRRLRPRYVAIGEEAVSCVEGLRAANVAKQCGATVIAGGCFFGNVASEVLSTALVDIVVHGEGERTIVELMQVLLAGDDDALGAIRGISFRDRESVRTTPAREPIPDLDSLPMPAYDLLPVDCYGRESRNHRDFAAIELSRGCPHRCSFCVLWRQMGRFHDSNVSPCLRTKSPERAVEEIRVLRQRFGRKYLGWVDPCFNADPKVPQRVAELMLQHGFIMGQSAWVRADHLRRDTESGALGACVRSGLNELYIGLERPDNSELSDLGKGMRADAAVATLRLIAQRFPQVLTVGSFIYGIPGDTPASLKQFVRNVYSIPLDLYLFIPLTPLPGTPFWDSKWWDSSGRSFRYLNFLPGSSTAGELSSALGRDLFFKWSPERISGLIRSLLRGDSRRRRASWRHMARGTHFWARYWLSMGGSSDGMRLPAWYES